MQPTDPKERQRLIDQAAKTFPRRDRAGLERDFDEMERLSAERFTHEDGRLAPKDEARLKKLAKQFSPF